MKHFWLRNSEGFPCCCVATEKNNDIVIFALATHNPKDKFSRDFGRKVAVGRIEANRYHGAVTLGEQIKKRLVEFIAGDGSLPQRARDAAKLWLTRQTA